MKIISWLNSCLKCIKLIYLNVNTVLGYINININKFPQLYITATISQLNPWMLTPLYRYIKILLQYKYLQKIVRYFYKRAYLQHIMIKHSRMYPATNNNLLDILFLNRLHRDSANAVPANKNYTPEISTLGIFARVSSTVVQWKSLALEEPPFWSR